MTARKGTQSGPAKKSPYDLGKPGGLERFWLPFADVWVARPLVGYILFRVNAGTTAAYWVPPLLAVLGGASFAVAWARSQGRRADARWHLGLSFLSFFWMVAIHAMFGPFAPWQDHLWPRFWAIFGLFYGLTWWIPRTESARGTGDDGRTVKGVDLDKLGLAEGTIVKPFPGRVEITHAAGEGVKEVQGSLGKWASIARLPAGTQLRARMGDRADQTVIEALPVGTLAGPFPLPGPSRPGGSVLEPIRLGVREDGSPFETADRSHAMEMGMSGSGKTVSGLVSAYERLSRRDVVQLWCDPIKGVQFAKPLLGHALWVAKDMTDAKQMVKAIERAIEPQANALARHDITEWSPEAWDRYGIPAVHVQFEEAAWLVDHPLLVKLAERARSVGIYFTMSLQRASHSRMDTDVRANLARRFCFGVMDDQDASFCIPDDVLDMGTSPARWRNKQPGMCLPDARDIPDEWVGKPFKGYMPSDNGTKEGYKEFAAALVRLAKQRATPNPELANVLGVETGRPVVAPGFTAPQPASVTSDEGEDDVPDEAAEYAEIETEVDGLEPLDLPVEEPEDVDTARIAPTDEGPDGDDDIDLGEPETVELTTKQRNALFAGVLRDVAKDSRGRPYVLQSEVASAWMDVPGAKRPWAYHRLERLERDGHVHRDEDDPKVWWLEPGAFDADSEGALTSVP